MSRNISEFKNHSFLCTELVGVLVGGTVPCGASPDIYISVVAFTDWIEQWIKP